MKCFRSISPRTGERQVALNMKRSDYHWLLEQGRLDRIERIYWGFVKTIVALAIVGLVVLAIYTILQPKPITPEPPATAAPDPYIATVAYIAPTPEPTPAPEPTPFQPRYELTPNERDIVERIISIVEEVKNNHPSLFEQIEVVISL